MSGEKRTVVLASVLLLLSCGVAAADTDVTLLAQDPSTIYRNSTGTFNVSWGISHSSAGLNNTSVSLIWTVYDVVAGCYNHSIRPPSNDKAAPLIVGGTNYGKIQRGDNRNDTLYFENNVTITGGNVYHWSGCDKQADRLAIIPVNSTYSKVFLNSSFAAMLGNMYYLDRTDQQGAVMTEQRIYKNHPLLIKIWDLEKMKTRSDHIIVGYADTHMAGSSTRHVSVYYLNSSYDPAGAVDPLDSPYAAYISAHTESTWVDYVHTIRNSTYIKTFEVNATSLPVNTTPAGYLYFTSNEPSQHKAFCINISDGATITNRSFADTSTLWTGTSAPLTSELYTPNVFISWRNNNRQFQTKLYAADNNDVWGNSTLHTSDIEISSFDPTIPTIDHFNFDSTTDYVMNGTYSDTIAVGVGVATDPDGGSVTHNLTLWYANRTFVAIINNMFTDADRTNLYAHIDFNTIPYYSKTEEYTLKVVATDDEGQTAQSWLGVNFRLGAGGIQTETKVPVSIFITLTVLMLCGVLYMFHAKTHISRIFTTLIAAWMAFMLSQMIVSGNVVRMVSALDSTDTWIHDTVAIQIPGLSYLLLFIAVIMSIFLVKFVIDFGLEVIREAQREKM